MGACAYKTDNKPIENTSGLPDFYYLSRDKGRVLFITSKGIKKIEFMSRMDFALDSSVIYLKDERFLVVGGARNSEMLVEVYLADPIKKEIDSRSPLPFGVFGGDLHEHGSWLYYVGGLCKGNNGLETAPLMRYSLSLDI